MQSRCPFDRRVPNAIANCVISQVSNQYFGDYSRNREIEFIYIDSLVWCSYHFLLETAIEKQLLFSQPALPNQCYLYRYMTKLEPTLFIFFKRY